MNIIKYIEIHFSGNKSAFARHMNVIPQHVSKWVRDEWIVIDGKLYSPRRDMPHRGMKATNVVLHSSVAKRRRTPGKADL